MANGEKVYWDGEEVNMNHLPKPFSEYEALPGRLLVAQAAMMRAAAETRVSCGLLPKAEPLAHFMPLPAPQQQG